jgi:hypothetical protein
MGKLPETAPPGGTSGSPVAGHRVGQPLEGWARNTAELLLAREVPRRWAHTQGVARRARRVAMALPLGERPVLVASA